MKSKLTIVENMCRCRKSLSHCGESVVDTRAIFLVHSYMRVAHREQSEIWLRSYSEE